MSVIVSIAVKRSDSAIPSDECAIVFGLYVESEHRIIRRAIKILQFLVEL